MSSEPARVLVVAHRTAATPALLDAVRERAVSSPARFTLLVPKTVHGLTRLMDPEDVPSDESDAVLELALPLLEEAAGAPVGGVIGAADPLAAVEDAINLYDFDEVIVSTLSTRVSRWLHIDLPHKIAGLGLPVRIVTARERARARSGG
jgi:hypothetical protein